MRGMAITAVATLLLAACESYNVDAFNAPIVHKYPTPAGAGERCLDASARARKWCRDQNLNTDTFWADNCRTAQWDYNAACR